MKIKAVLFFFVGRCRFSGETILCLFNKMEHFRGKFPWRASYIVHSHLKISNNHYILKKLENSCVLGRKMKKSIKQKIDNFDHFCLDDPLNNYCGILEPQNLTFPRLQCHYQSGY